MHLNRIARKLNNKSGNSIMMALLLLLVATVVSIVIVTVALTSTMHVTDNKQSQQEYLACVSAANMLRDGLNGSKYEYSTESGITTKKYTLYEPKYIYEYIYDYSEYEDYETIAETTPQPKTTSKILDDFVTSVSETIKSNTSEDPDVPLFTDRKFEITQADMYEVTATCKLAYVDKEVRPGTATGNVTSLTTTIYNYDLKINLQTQADESSQGYRMSITIPISKSVEKKEYTDSRTCQHTYWEQGNEHYNRKGKYGSKTKKDHDFNMTKITTTYVWGGNGTKISKGWS